MTFDPPFSPWLLAPPNGTGGAGVHQCIHNHRSEILPVVVGDPSIGARRAEAFGTDVAKPRVGLGAALRFDRSWKLENGFRQPSSALKQRCSRLPGKERTSTQ